MNMNEFLRHLVDEYGTAEFAYKGKNCGVEPETKNGVTTYCMWYDKIWKDYKDIREVLSDKFFDGQSLRDILPEIDVWF